MYMASMKKKMLENISVKNRVQNLNDFVSARTKLERLCLSKNK